MGLWSKKRTKGEYIYPKMTKIYEKGRNREYKKKYELEKEGFDIVQRTAGSHSPFDLIAIKLLTREIKLIQVKPENYKETKKLNEKWKDLNNIFRCSYEVR